MKKSIYKVEKRNAGYHEHIIESAHKGHWLDGYNEK